MSLKFKELQPELMMLYVKVFGQVADMGGV